MYEAIDLYYTSTGDLELSPDGDLLDTSADEFRSLRQEVATVALSNFGDWALHPNLGANLRDLIGYPNTEGTADLIKTQLDQALTQHLLQAGDYRLDILPLDAHTLGVLLTVKTGETAGEIQAVTIPLIFDLGLGVYAA